MQEEKKLKTLKDIQADALIIWECDYKKNKHVERIAVSDDLRQVARGWIKEMERQIEFYKNDSISTKSGIEAFINHASSQICWIRHFFNLENE